MHLSCLGSIHALEQTSKHSFWRHWLKGELPSADTIGRVVAAGICDDVRLIPQKLYRKLKRNKALKPVFGNWFGLIIDGHETMASYMQCCKDCLQRKIQTKHGERIQYYHRHVMAMLWCDNMCLPLDVEPQRPGEDEVAAALRLLQRLLEQYPRAFDFIMGDGLYLKQGVLKLARKHNKFSIIVLKDEKRDLLQDARGLFRIEPSTAHQAGRIHRECWDIEGFQPWFKTDSEFSLRVVRSLEKTTTRRQRTKKDETQTTEWIWATDIPKELMPTQPFVECAHQRWNIENQGFNELANQWHFNHTYKHDLTAMINFWLLTMIAYILFHAFFLLNLKPQLRDKHSKKHFMRTIMAELFATEPKPPP